MNRQFSIEGYFYGRLYVLFRYDERLKHGEKSRWFCECACGRFKVVRRDKLTSGAVKSCGCIKTERKREVNDRRLISIWKNMKTRCYSTKKTDFHCYGGRGISVCSEWMSYNVFSQWALNNGYSSRLTLDRIDNDGNYEPSNCRWVTRQRQSNNMRTNQLLTYNGKTQSIADWSRETSISQGCIWSRKYKSGWSTERTLTTPTRNI